MFRVITLFICLWFCTTVFAQNGDRNTGKNLAFGIDAGINIYNLSFDPVPANSNFHSEFGSRESFFVALKDQNAISIRTGLGHRKKKASFDYVIADTTYIYTTNFDYLNVPVYIYYQRRNYKDSPYASLYMGLNLNYLLQGRGELRSDQIEEIAWFYDHEDDLYKFETALEAGLAVEMPISKHPLNVYLSGSYQAGSNFNKAVFSGFNIFHIGYSIRAGIKYKLY